METSVSAVQRRRPQCLQFTERNLSVSSSEMETSVSAIQRRRPQCLQFSSVLPPLVQLGKEWSLQEALEKIYTYGWVVISITDIILPDLEP